MREGSPFLPDEDASPEEKAPWSFRLVVVLTALYLLWRLVQGVMWVLHRVG